MARETLTQVLETIKTLEPDELREVQEAVQERLGPRRYSPEEERFHTACAGVERRIMGEWRTKPASW
jgi:hypothetical protein